MILVFGATGFSGRMVVEQLVARGLPVRGAARSRERLEELAGDFPGIDIAVADVEAPASVVAAAAGCELLITTVGPYTRFGAVALEAALEQAIPYIDITGEPAWLRRVFFEYDQRAQERELPLLPAFGYDYVPGNLAGAIALERAGEAALQVDIAYFLAGSQERSTKSFSKGTLDSLDASSKERGHVFEQGTLRETDGPRKKLQFQLDDELVTAVAIGGSEHITLPRFAPWLQNVNVGLGWFAAGQKAPEGPAPQQAGPDGATRERSRARIVALARSESGEILSEVRVDGPNPYDMSGLLTAWAGERILEGAKLPGGALGPIEAFGLEQLRNGCASVGLIAE